MQNKLQNINFDDFQKHNINNIEVFYDSLNQIVLSSIINHNVETIESSLELITNNYEKIHNILSLNDTQNAICYYYGRISSITDLALDIIKEKTTSKLLDNVLNSYSLLLPALKVIEKYGTVSGANLKKELALKSNSNLSNFIKRINKYNLIEVNKIGTSNYYTLSLLGKRILNNSYSNCPDEEIETKIGFKDLLYLLNGINVEIGEPNANALAIFNDYINFELNINEKRLLKHKLDSIIYTRDNYVGNLFQNTLKLTNVNEDNVFYEEYDSDTDEDAYVYNYPVINIY